MRALSFLSRTALAMACASFALTPAVAAPAPDASLGDLPAAVNN